MLPNSSFSASNTTAYGRLVRREFTPHELPSLIEAILSSNDDGEMIHCLPGDEPQSFVDVIYEARSTFTRYRETNANVFWELGTVFTWSLSAGSKEIRQVVIQGMSPTRASSEDIEGSHSL